jgi:hypothetical protein
MGTVNIVPRSEILVALMMDAIRSCATSVLTRATRSNIPEDGILHSDCSENLKSNKITVVVRQLYLEAYYKFKICLIKSSHRHEG